MTTRSKQQKIASRGHNWLKLAFEKHKDWLARDLGEDYGVDIEAELTENDLVNGEILKIQIKTSGELKHTGSAVEVRIKRKYVEYAEVCRYPLIIIFIDLAKKSRLVTLGERVVTQKSWKILMPDSENLSLASMVF